MRYRARRLTCSCGCAIYFRTLRNNIPSVATSSFSLPTLPRALLPSFVQRISTFVWVCLFHYVLRRAVSSHSRSAAAFRFFRTCLRLKNGNIFKHIVKHDVFRPILALTTRESKRDNLVSSTCLEFFDFMRRVRNPTWSPASYPSDINPRIGKHQRAHTPLHDEAWRHNTSTG